MSSPGARTWKLAASRADEHSTQVAGASSLFDYLCERNAVLGNPSDGVKRPATTNNEGSTPAPGDAQLRRLFEEALPRKR
jgi:hypothetical protein